MRKQRDEKVNDIDRELTQVHDFMNSTLFLGGRVGFALVAVLQLATLPVLDASLTTAVYCFSYTIPVDCALFCSAACHLSFNPSAHPIHFWFVRAMGLLSLVSLFVGVGSIFIHFSWIAFGTFIGTGLLYTIASDLIQLTPAERDKLQQIRRESR